MDLLDRLIRLDGYRIYKVLCVLLGKSIGRRSIGSRCPNLVLEEEKRKKKIGFFPGERSNLGWDRSKAKANIISLVVTKLPKKFISIHIRVGTLLYFDIRG